MFKQLTFNMIAGFLLLGAQAHAHPIEARVALEPEAEGAVHAGKVHFEFQLVDTKVNKILSDQDLRVMHEKKLHFYIYDPALVEFRHLHPDFNGKVWSVDTDLSVNGNYWVWAQGQLGSDNSEFLGANRLVVDGGAPANPFPARLGNVREGSDANSVVTIAAGKIHAKTTEMLIAQVTHQDGTAPQLTNYLGAKAHITVVSGDADALIHVHPMEMSDPNQLMIHATFPEAGDYRIWIQIMDGGLLKTVPLSVTVQD